jgi:uncharacterized membrane protein
MMAVVKRHFVSGMLVVVPLILTYLVLKFMFELVDGVLQPLIIKIFGFYIPGLGLVTTILAIILAGVLTRNFVGARLYRAGDRILERMPIIRPIYSAAKQLLEAVAQPSRNSFKAVVLIEYPRPGVWAMAFLSNRMEVEVNGGNRHLVSVFVPSTPTPISGMVVMLPEDDAVVLDMSVEDGVKFLVSGGVASPSLIKRRPVAVAQP